MTVMVNNSNNINNYLSPQITAGKKKDHNIQHRKSKLRQTQTCGRVKLINGIPTLPLLIIGSPLTIQIKGNKKTTKMNDNINMDMDSTIAGSASLSI
jgi:hypothetical protein